MRKYLVVISSDTLCSVRKVEFVLDEAEVFKRYGVKPSEEELILEEFEEDTSCGPCLTKIIIKPLEIYGNY
jgi:hypothetical protein